MAYIERTQEAEAFVLFLTTADRNDENYRKALITWCEHLGFTTFSTNAMAKRILFDEPLAYLRAGGDLAEMATRFEDFVSEIRQVLLGQEFTYEIEDAETRRHAILFLQGMHDAISPVPLS